MKRTLVTLTALSLMLGSTGATLVRADELELEHSGEIEVNQEVKTVEGRPGIFRDLQQKFRTSVSEREANLKLEAEARKEAMAKTRATIKAEVELKKEDRKEMKKEDKRIDKAIKADEKSNKKVTGLLRAFGNVISHLENMITRINTRIAKIKAAGGDTTVAETKVAAALADLAKAKLQVNALAQLNLGIASGTASTTASTTLKVKLTDAKRAADLVKATLKSVHNNLEGAVQSLNLSVKGDGHASSTATSTRE